MIQENKFIHLHVHSDNSLLDGFGTITEYVNKAKELGMTALALTDHGTMTGIYSFIKECKKAGIKPIPGVEFNVAPISSFDKTPISYTETGPQFILGNGTHTHLTVLAKNETGLRNLFKLVSESYSIERYHHVPRIDLDLLIEHKEGLIILSGCPNSELNVRLKLKQGKEALSYISRMKSIFGDDFYIEVMSFPLSQQYSDSVLCKIIEKTGVKGILSNDVHYLKQEDSEAQERIMALGKGSKMDETPSYKGGLRPALGGHERYFKSFEEMQEDFPYEKYKSLYENTIEIANKIENIELEYDPNLLPKLEIPKEFKNSIEYFDYLVKQGFKKKRSHLSQEVQAASKRKIKEERDLIISNDFVDYFLVVQDYLAWSVNNGYPIGPGRGCFLKGNKVQLLDKTVNIEDVKIGDELMTFEYSQEKINNVFKYYVENEIVVDLELSNGQQISCTGDHLIMTNLSYIRAEDLNENSILLTPNHTGVKILKKRIYTYTGEVYDLEVSNKHNYNVGGVTVHNSVGGSEIAYLLNISNTDPIRFDLLFERFLSDGRGAIYEIEYEDGSKEEFLVNKKHSNGKYTWQLEVGDEIE